MTEERGTRGETSLSNSAAGTKPVSACQISGKSKYLDTPILQLDQLVGVLVQKSLMSCQLSFMKQYCRLLPEGIDQRERLQIIILGTCDSSLPNLAQTNLETSISVVSGAVSQCSVRPATAAATPPCSATPCQRQLQVRHRPADASATPCSATYRHHPTSLAEVVGGCRGREAPHPQRKLLSWYSTLGRPIQLQDRFLVLVLCACWLVLAST